MRNIFYRITMIIGIVFFGGWCVTGAILYIIAIANAILNKSVLIFISRIGGVE